MKQFARLVSLIGEKGLARLQKSTVLICGVGGVGSYTVEALARAGLGKLILVDPDLLEVTNLNRQLPALFSTIGQYKVDVLKERIQDINPRAEVDVYRQKVTPENVTVFFEEELTFVVEAIDQVQGKVAIVETALAKKIPLALALGVANRLDPTQLKCGWLSETKGCPLARAMRRELKRKGLTPDVKVVYSTELPLKTPGGVLGSISFVPSVAGLFLAAEVVHEILKEN